MSWHPTRLTAAQLEERRLVAGRLLRAGRLSQAEIARQVGVTPAAVCRWARQLRQVPRGLAPLRQRPRTGRPPRLTAAQWTTLLAQLHQGAPAAGFDTERWTLSRIAVVVRRRFGIRRHPTSLSRGLRARGWSVHRPQPRARERDARRIAQWRHRDWARLKRGPGARAAPSSAWTKPATPSAPGSARRGRRGARCRRSTG